MSDRQTVSPRQFDALQRWMLHLEASGYTPTECVEGACNAARIKHPRPFVPMEIVVDPLKEDPHFVYPTKPVTNGYRAEGDR